MYLVSIEELNNVELKEISTVILNISKNPYKRYSNIGNVPKFFICRKEQATTKDALFVKDEFPGFATAKSNVHDEIIDWEFHHIDFLKDHAVVVYKSVNKSYIGFSEMAYEYKAFKVPYTDASSDEYYLIFDEDKRYFWSKPMLSLSKIVYKHKAVRGDGMFLEDPYKQ